MTVSSMIIYITGVYRLCTVVESQRFFHRNDLRLESCRATLMRIVIAINYHLLGL